MFTFLLLVLLAVWIGTETCNTVVLHFLFYSDELKQPLAAVRSGG